LWLVGVGLSPDGQQVAAAYFTRATHGPNAKILLNLRLWKVGTQEPLAIKQMPASPDAQLDLASGSPHHRPEGFVQYCDHGAGIMISDPHGTLYYLNPQTLEVLHATETNVPLGRNEECVLCAANSPRAVFAAYGGFGNGPYGNGLVRVYDLTSGTVLQEWDLTKHAYYFGDAAISPGGSQIAVSRVPENGMRRAKDVVNLELFDVRGGKLTLQLKTGHLPGRITFAGENRIATDDTAPPQPFFPHPKIRLWDASSGKLISEFSDSKVGARRFVGASSDGSVILGYIPKESLRTAPMTSFWNESLEQRFRLWDVATGKTIATSPLIFPRLNLTVNRRNPELDPSLELSADGHAVLVFWKSRWNDIYPIYVFTEAAAPAAPASH
jgi:WD40 repeat protein